MIFQDPFACLHPMYRVGDQIVEAVRVHEKIPKQQAADRAVELLGAVGIPNPGERFHDYPHQYSGGMRQRAMIAMATGEQPRRADRRRADDGARRHGAGADPRADRPRARRSSTSGVILITHDLGVIAEVAQTGDGHVRRPRRWSGARRDELFAQPLHPYTWGLLESIPPCRREGHAARADRGLAAVADQRPAGLSVPSALPAPVRAVRPGAAGVQRPRRRASRGVSPLRRRQAASVGRAAVARLGVAVCT